MSLATHVALFFRQPDRIQTGGNRMIKRIEFTLNLADPHEAAIYRALRPSLRYRRGGAVIRQALEAHLVPEKRSHLQIKSQERHVDGQ